MHVISKIISQADLRIKNWYFFFLFLAFKVKDIYGPKPLKKTGEYPSQIKIHVRIVYTAKM